MAGISRDNSTEHQRILTIETWMLSNIRNHGYQRYDDLHIDGIDPMWRSRDTWIEGGIEALRIATRLRDCHAPDLAVVLAYSLKANEKPQGVDFQTPDELAARLDWSPPSLYLFQKGKEPWTETGILNGDVIAEQVVIENLDASVIGMSGQAKRCYCMEFRQVEFEEWSRTLFVEG